MNLIKQASLIASLCLALSACEGDSRAFSEAVEVRGDNLTSIEITPPANSVDDIYLNIDQLFQFGVDGVSAAGTRTTLDANERSWRVSDSSVATIDGDGLLSAVSNGFVNVSLEIGGLTATDFFVTVQDEELEQINAISGEGFVERCLPQDYFATGIFTDGTTRNLDSVTWSLPGTEATDATVLRRPDGTATLTPLNVAMLDLTASSGTTALSQAVEVIDTLRTLVITPNPATVDVDETLTLIGTAGYSNEAPIDGEEAAVATRVVISEQMNWTATTGTEVLSVSNEEGTRGLVTGLVEGVASVSGSCGITTDSRTIIVSTDDTDSTELSFNVSSTFYLSLSQTGGFQLLVSTGSSYSNSNDITDEITWTSTNLESTSSPISLDSSGLVTPANLGTATVTATDEDDVSITLTIEVVDS